MILSLKTETTTTVAATTMWKERGRERGITMWREECGTVGGLTWNMAWNLLFLGSLVATNMLSLYNLTISRELDRYLMGARVANGIRGNLLEELSSIREELRHTQHHLLQARLSIQHGQETHKSFTGSSGNDTVSGSLTRRFPLSAELGEYIAIRRLPLGRNPSYGEAVMVSSIGYACLKSLKLLKEYLQYNVGQNCPDDWDLAQKLMLRGCEPLPRRRCFSRTPSSNSHPMTFPRFMGSNFIDDTALWNHYTCKSSVCLNLWTQGSNVSADCAHCFYLEGPAKARRDTGRDRLDVIKADDIPALKQGTIRIGLDLGGGSGSFAADMRRYNATIITSNPNLNGPVNEFVAMRGLLPLYSTISQRLPFFDNTLDLVRSTHILSGWIPSVSLEFLLYDIDRTLHPGGLFWLEHFVCRIDELESVYGPMLEKLGYIKHSWITGTEEELDGVNHGEICLSALLEKPIRKDVA